MRRDDICRFLGPADLARLKAPCADRNVPRKFIWRAEIVLATADGCGPNEIMPRANRSKPTVWRWQECYLDEGVAGDTGVTKPGPLGCRLYSGRLA